MNVELRIGRLVVHGAAEFDREAFVDALRLEIASRLPAGSNAGEAGRRFAASRAEGDAAAMTPSGVAGVASAVARRLLP